MTQSLPASTSFPADWYDDPYAPGARVLRFWDGAAWTPFVHDLGIDIVPAPGPTDDSDASVTDQDPQSDEAEDADETASDGLEAAPGRKIGLFGARKAAKQLAQENDELQRQMSELTETVARYEAELEELQQDSGRKY